LRLSMKASANIKAFSKKEKFQTKNNQVIQSNRRRETHEPLIIKLIRTIFCDFYGVALHTLYEVVTR